MNDRTVAKSVFKAQALRYFREVELSGEPLVITDRGKPVLRLLPYSNESPNEILASLRGTVKDYQAPLEPIGLGPVDIWHSEPNAGHFSPPGVEFSVE